MFRTHLTCRLLRLIVILGVSIPLTLVASPLLPIQVNLNNSVWTINAIQRSFPKNVKASLPRDQKFFDMANGCIGLGIQKLDRIYLALTKRVSLFNFRLKRGQILNINIMRYHWETNFQRRGSFKNAGAIWLFFLNWSCLHNISSVIESNADRVVPLPRALRHYTIWLGVNHLFEGCDIDGVSRLFSVSEMGHQDGVSVCCSTCLSDVGECLVSKRHLDVNDFRNT